MADEELEIAELEVKMVDEFIQESDDGDFHNQLSPADKTHLKQQYVQSWLLMWAVVSLRGKSIHVTV